MAASTFAWLSVVKRAENVINRSASFARVMASLPFVSSLQMLRKDGNLINFIFVVCLELVLWFLFLLWNLYCGYIDQNDNEIQIFFFFPCHPGLFLWWVCPRNIYLIGYGLSMFWLALFIDSLCRCLLFLHTVLSAQCEVQSLDPSYHNICSAMQQCVSSSDDVNIPMITIPIRTIIINCF